MNRFALDLITTRSRCLRISLQPHQQFPELLLPRTCRASPRPLAAQIDQLGNPLPTGAARARVFATGEEFLFILARLGKRLVLLPVIVLIELVRPFLSRGDCLRLFLRRDFGTAFKVEITAFPPLSGGTKVCVSGTSDQGRTREWQWRREWDGLERGEKKGTEDEVKVEFTSLVRALVLRLYRMHRIVIDLAGLWNRSR